MGQSVEGLLVDGAVPTDRVERGRVEVLLVFSIILYIIIISFFIFLIAGQYET